MLLNELIWTRLISIVNDKALERERVKKSIKKSPLFVLFFLDRVRSHSKRTEERKEEDHFLPSNPLSWLHSLRGERDSKERRVKGKNEITVGVRERERAEGFSSSYSE